MKKIIFLIFLLSLGFIFITPSQAISNVIINEFSPSSITEWIELLNPTSSSIDLTGYKISDGLTILKTLSGTIPKTGMLTFDLSADSIGDSGDCLVLLNPSDVGIYSISFGSGSCASGDHLAGVPTSTETAGITSGTTWDVITAPSKGWCNDSYGGCPTISSIVAAINSSGVTTNLGTQIDYSRITGLYFEKTGRGKIEFTNEMNFTDSDSLSWLSNLDTKLDLATTGKIVLDADLIKNLVNTGATLTMYGLSLNDPEVLVNGASDTGGIVSSLSYTKSTGTLVFNVAHFTTFTANEKSTSSGSSNSNYNGSAPVCGDSKPLGLPDLFQINVTQKTAKLFFTPLTTTNNYYVSFSENPNAENYGELVTLMREGVQSHTVYFLKPKTTYYFKVRGQNGCMPGDWSNIMKVKTNNSIYYRYFSTTNLPISTVNTIKTTPVKTQLSKNVNPISTLTPSPVPTVTITNHQTTETLPSTPTSKTCFLWWCW